MSRIIAAIIAVAVALSTACTKDTNLVVEGGQTNVPIFTASTIEQQSRATSKSAFADGDTFGIFQNKYPGQSTYTYSESEKMLTTSAAPYFTNQSTDVFYAYSPYYMYATYGDVAIDVSDQSSADIDLLVSGATTSTESSRYVQLTFRHLLSLVELTLETNDSLEEEDLEGVTIYIDCIVDGHYAIFDDIITPGLTTSRLYFTDNSAILIPNDYSKTTLYFELSDGTILYKDLGATLASGYKYSITATLGDKYIDLTLDEESIGWYNKSITASTSDVDIYFDGEYYNIFTAAGMKAFADLVNCTENSEAVTAGEGFASYNVYNQTIKGKLMNNIDLSVYDSWTPIGEWNNGAYDISYNGTFDGCGHEITNMTIECNDTDSYNGLFGCTNGATIQNLGVIDSSIKEEPILHNGFIAGYAVSSNITNCYCKDCEIGSCWGCSGGVVGTIIGTTIESCYSYDTTVEVENQNYPIGGIVGEASNNSSINNCYCTKGSLILFESSAKCGGIVGQANATSITDSYNTSTINIESLNANTPYIGGVAGDCLNGSSITNCYNNGVTFIASHDAESTVYSGGLVGCTDNATVKNSYNLAEITATGTEGDCYIGGIVGYADNSLEVYNCYNAGSFDASTYNTGAILGLWGKSLAATVSCNYGTSANTYTVENDGYTPKTDDEMKAEDFVVLLNSGAKSYPSLCSWLYNLYGYPSHLYTSLPSNTEGYYTISTAEELAVFRDLVNGGASAIDGVLTADIDLEGDEDNQWEAIGTYSSYSNNKPFSATFDGAGHTISGLYINNTDDYQGLFGYCDAATIKNLNVGGSVTSEGDSIALICGHADNDNATTTGKTTTISNCSTLAGSSVEVSSTSGNKGRAGGIVGNIIYGTVERCINRADIVGENYCGGVAGYVAYSKVYYCANFGSVTGKGSSNEDAGGVVGRITLSSSEMANCYSIADVSNEYRFVGGVAGACTSSAVVRNCYSSGTVEGSSNVGGAIGYLSSATSSNCYYNSSLYTSGETNDCTGYTTANMTDGSLRLKLNTGLVISSDDTLWIDGADGYPTFDFVTE